jgi:titin
LTLEALEDRLVFSVYAVINTADSGEGSLRQAILDANAHPGRDTIIFDIPGAHAHTIKPLSPLPTITDPVVIDGTTQPGYAGSPLIILDGGLAGSQASGLVIVGGDSTVRGLDVGNFGKDGIQLGTQLHSPGGNVVAGTWILGNGRYGVDVVGSPGNTIGGTGALDGNVISANLFDGIYIVYGDHSVVEGNFIGTDATGTMALGNGPDGGVYVSAGSDITIGGTVPGARNLISGNEYDGVLLDDLSYGAHIQGNYIGTDVTGTRPLGNSTGVWDAGQGDMIGGSEAGAGNLISGNRSGGVEIKGSRDIVAGNRIGTDASGTQPLGNGATGVAVDGDFGGANNVIGGTATGAGNLISGNADAGVAAVADATQVEGNFIGTDRTGTLALGNRGAGVRVLGLPYTITIGGTTPGAGNVISGNAGDGVVITYGGLDQVQGNLIGTDGDGDQPLPNGGSGVSVGGGAVVAGVIIGGIGPGAGNVISGNDGDGVHITSFGVKVLGNAIGTDITETKAVANGQNGVLIEGAAHDNLIGGATLGAGNLISGNTLDGIVITGDNGQSNQIQGNLIGTDALGTTALPNLDGVFLHDTSATVIGGTGTGTGNLISGNSRDGVLIKVSHDNLVQGNLIGTDASEASPLGNGYMGVALAVDSSNNTIGGTVAGAPNIIAFNGNSGVLVDTGTGNAILGNAIFGHDNGLGIELLDGGNHNQEFPTITAAFSFGGVTTIEGTLTSTPSTTFHLEFFVNSVCNPNGYGEGEQFLASFLLTTDADGNAAFMFTVAVAVDPGQFIAATATDPGNNTSAFSACAEVSEAAPTRVLISSISAIPNGIASARELASPSWGGAGPDAPGVETTASLWNPLPANNPPVGPFTAAGSRHSASGGQRTTGPADLFFKALGEDLDG